MQQLIIAPSGAYSDHPKSGIKAQNSPFKQDAAIPVMAKLYFGPVSSLIGFFIFKYLIIEINTRMYILEQPIKYL